MATASILVGRSAVFATTQARNTDRIAERQLVFAALNQERVSVSRSSPMSRIASGQSGRVVAAEAALSRLGGASPRYYIKHRAVVEQVGVLIWVI